MEQILLQKGRTFGRSSFCNIVRANPIFIDQKVFPQIVYDLISEAIHLYF